MPIKAKIVIKRPVENISFDFKNPDPNAMALGGVLIGKAIEEEHISAKATDNINSP